MASFDLQTWAKLQGQTGTDLLGSVGSAFGLPSCAMNLTREALGLLPSDLLNSLSGDVKKAKGKAADVAKRSQKRISLESGLYEVNTEDGSVTLVSDTSVGEQDSDDSQLAINFEKISNAINAAKDTFAQIYQNVENQVGLAVSIGECIKSVSELNKYKSGNSATAKLGLGQQELSNYLDNKYAAEISKVKAANGFFQAATNLENDINSVLAERAANPDLEPKFVDSQEVKDLLEGSTYETVPQIDPNLEDEDEVFRLTYGPPVTADGIYILSNDGLYYDSQTGGLDPVLLSISGIVNVGDVWTYEYDPNLGGKGQAVSLEDLNIYNENLFDPKIIDDSISMKIYYDEDHFLTVLKQQRDKYILDLSADLVEYGNEYGVHSAIYKNHRNLIYSELNTFNQKINKRKKQIEIAVKAPNLFGGGNETNFSPGEIPINDFSYLADYKISVDLSLQKSLVFEVGDVDGVVLPLQPKYSVLTPKPPSITYQHLNVPKVGKGGIIYSSSATNDATVLSLTDLIVSDELFAIYNFLETHTVVPSSIEFKTSNCATENNYNNAQLAAASKSQVFFSGLSIPYLEGIVKNKSTYPTGASAMGSYLKLPDTPEFNNMMFNPSGFTMECWVHVPNIMDAESGWLSSTTSSLTKVILGNENVGNASGAKPIDKFGNLLDLDELPNDLGSQYVRGLLCGFTRDRRITQEKTGYSNLNSENDPVSSLSFFVAPTISRDLSSASFVNKSKDECKDEPSFYKMKVDLSATQFGDVSSQFVLIDVVCDPQENSMKFYADGSLVATSSLSDVFGIQEYTTIDVPTYVKSNSFEYSKDTVDGPTTLHGGPKFNEQQAGLYFTPWIVGGGYTDGMYKYGNFLGGDRGGIVSGLRGYIGSLKFYSKPLDNQEVLRNYNAQKGLFKNILT